MKFCQTFKYNSESMFKISGGLAKLLCFGISRPPAQVTRADRLGLDLF